MLSTIRPEADANRSHFGASLESKQLALKIPANAASYGNFVELYVEDLAQRSQQSCYVYNAEPRAIAANKIEEPTRYFHALIAALITGAARLILEIIERLVLDSWLDWAFCDTDSNAIANTAEMDELEFNGRTQRVLVRRE